MSFAVMVHMGFRTHDGTPLSKLPYFVQRFEVAAVISYSSFAVESCISAAGAAARLMPFSVRWGRICILGCTRTKVLTQFC